MKHLDEIDPQSIATLVVKIDELIRKIDEMGSPRVTVLRKSEVAAQLGVTVWTVDNWVKRGTFPAPIYLQPGSPASWRVKDIEAYLEKCKRARRPKRSARGAVKQRLEQGKDDDN